MGIYVMSARALKELLDTKMPSANDFGNEVGRGRRGEEGQDSGEEAREREGRGADGVVRVRLQSQGMVPGKSMEGDKQLVEGGKLKDENVRKKRAVK